MAATTLNLIDSNTVLIHHVDAVVDTKYQTPNTPFKPYGYRVRVGFVRVNGDDVVKDRLPVLMLTPAKMFYLQRGLGARSPQDCVEKVFAVNPKWKAYDSGSALNAFVDEVTAKVYLHYIECLGIDNRFGQLTYLLRMTYKPPVDLSGRSLGYLLVHKVWRLLASGFMSSIIVTADELKHIRTVTKQCDTNSNVEYFDVDPSWYGAFLSPEHCVNALLSKTPKVARKKEKLVQ